MIILSLTLVEYTMCDRFLSILFSEVGPPNSPIECLIILPHPFSPTTFIVGRKAKVDDSVLLRPHNSLEGSRYRNIKFRNGLLTAGCLELI